MKRILIAMPFLVLSLQAQVNDCDKNAGHPYDKTLPIKGIEFENIDANKAIKACKDSVKNEPKNIRYLYQLGRAYYKKEDYKQTVELYQKAADQGYVMAVYNLGNMYYRGKGVNQNYEKSFEYFQKAADQGLPLALNGLAVLYMNGQGVALDDKKAMELYQKAADEGIAVAQYNLGFIYDNGQGVKQDYKKAVEFYQKAADQGLANAQYNLAVMYMNGQGVMQDYKKAVEFYQKASDQGYANAQSNLGVMYENGLGVKQDYKKAVELFQKAADQGESTAQKNLKALKAIIAMNVIKELEEERKSSISYKASKLGNKIMNFFGPSNDTVISLATQYNISNSRKSDIEIIKSYEKDGKTVQILQIKDMVCEMPMLEVKGEWRAFGMNCKG